MKRPIHVSAIRQPEPNLDDFIDALARVVLARLQREAASIAEPEREEDEDA